MSLEESRRRKEFFKCSAPWSNSHLCGSGSIVSNELSRLRNCEFHLHIIRCFILKIEGEKGSSEEYQPPRKEGEYTNFGIQADL